MCSLRVRFLTALVLIAGSVATGEDIPLKNGDVLKGTIISSGNGYLIVRTADSELRLPMSRTAMTTSHSAPFGQVERSDTPTCDESRDRHDPR